MIKYKYNLPSEDDCILDAVLIVSPKRQYLGILVPTTPKEQYCKSFHNAQ